MSWIKRILKFWKAFQIIFLYLLSIVAVFLMYPREGKFRYEYSRGKPWMHETLVAPFDIPIYKSDQQLEAEMDSLRSNARFYFHLDTVIAWDMTNDLLAELVKLADGMGEVEDPGRWIAGGRTLFEILEEIYDRGIIEKHPVLEDRDPGGLTVMVLRQGVAEEVLFSDHFTERSAYEYFVGEINKINPGSEDILNNLIVNEYIQANLIYDEERSSQELEARLEELAVTQGMVQEGQRIIANGELVTKGNFLLIESLRKEYESNPNVGENRRLVYLGQFLLISLIFMSLYWFVRYFRKDIRQDRKQTFFTLALIIFMMALTMAAVGKGAFSVYVIPFVVIPIFLKTFFDIRYALFVHMITLLLAGFYLPNGYQFILMNFLAGLVGLFSMRSYYKRGILFNTAIFVFLTYALIFILWPLLQDGDLSQIKWVDVLWLGVNGILILTIYPLVFLFERLFGFISDATLFELSDTNQPLLRKLAETAPGTFQHSMQVANLAEEAILSVGGNSLLVRAGAMYHDIGKMDSPDYYIENQHDGINPHESMDFRESARKIISHVTKGEEIGKKHKLPSQVLDFIRTHHGTSTVQYFYRSFINANPEEEVDINEFTYPGPKPHSKETSVMMMADSVEAASRTLKHYSPDSISELVENIVAHQTKEDQFSDSSLTFGDITRIKQIFKNRLSNIYHSRIEYPQ